MKLLFEVIVSQQASLTGAEIGGHVRKSYLLLILKKYSPDTS